MLDASESSRMQPRTIAARVYRQIREDIVNGVYSPGEHLVRVTLAKRYGVSAIPVMEALYRLEIDGLVENSPQLGAHVVEISEKILEEDRTFREAIECQVARLFAERASETEKEQIRELAKFIDAIEEKMTGDGHPEMERMQCLFHRQHSAFHFAVAKMSGAQGLYRQMKRLWYRRLMATGDLHAVLYPVPKNWHIDLAESLASGDAERAEKHMRHHVSFRGDKFNDSVKELLRRGQAEFLDILMQRGENEVAD